MGRGFQKIIICGHVGRDPEVKTVGRDGKLVASFSVAVGGYKDQVEWFNIQAWEKLAEVIRDYVKKGSQILIEGVMQTRSWDDAPSGEKKYRTELLASNITLLGNGDSRDSKARRSDPEPYGDGTGIGDEDIPF